MMMMIYINIPCPFPQRSHPTLTLWLGLKVAPISLRSQIFRTHAVHFSATCYPTLPSGSITSWLATALKKNFFLNRVYSSANLHTRRPSLYLPPVDMQGWGWLPSHRAYRCGFGLLQMWPVVHIVISTTRVRSAPDTGVGVLLFSVNELKVLQKLWEESSDIACIMYGNWYVHVLCKVISTATIVLLPR